ncbi:unnamed protein product [Polarella glacialis]|uniref:Uncharacterized protein n=1 Tax=Polarella glacialis TaxID=89957 RepID=A0A813GL87_POLGL|nr:unnamed protein product [Polarella glacialis]
MAAEQSVASGSSGIAALMTTRHRKAHDKLLHNNDNINNINNNNINNNNQTVGLQSQTPENCHIDGRLVVTSQAPAGQGVGISKAPRTSRAAYLVGALLLCWPPAVQAHKVLAHHLLPYLEDSPPTMQVAVELCNVFKVVEKPYYILFASCWVCAVLQQIIDTTRYYEERNEELGLIQKCYVGSQLLALVLETATLWSDIDWNGANLWDMYNLYVYIFVHSSVFVRSVMMSMIVWDWLTAELLKRPVFGAEWDGQGWRDYHRALLLVIILQFGSSAFIMVLIMVTHVIPGMILYYPVFLLAAGFIIKMRASLTLVGIDPESRSGRGLVMATNSFVAVASFQAMITSMIRVYSGSLLRHSYFTPLRDDFASRKLAVWYECHLMQGFAAFHDQDFLNLFVR